MQSLLDIRRSKRTPVVNITSLIDVLFLLLIFFMVTSTFVRETALKVELPQARGETGAQQLQSVEVLVTVDRQILVNGRQAAMPEVRERVTSALAVLGDSHAVVRFSVDRGVPYGFAVEVMGELKSAGVKTVLAITEEKGDGQENR